MAVCPSPPLSVCTSLPPPSRCHACQRLSDCQAAIRRKCCQSRHLENTHEPRTLSTSLPSLSLSLFLSPSLVAPLYGCLSCCAALALPLFLSLYAAASGFNLFLTHAKLCQKVCNILQHTHTHRHSHSHTLPTACCLLVAAAAGRGCCALKAGRLISFYT